MPFAERLDHSQRLIDVRFNEILSSRAVEPTPPERDPADTAPERLLEAMRHAALAGGKRVRPFLVLETARLFGVPSEAAIDAAAAVELIHCYSLAHDDLPAMDNDELRRGQPTVWKAFDEWTAILAGDAALTLAFEVLTDPASATPPPVQARLVSCLARASGAAGMVGGQAFDLAADKLGEPPAPTVHHIRRLQAMKTGALITASCEMGAILGEASPADLSALRDYGRALGLAFQIADDLLDAEGDAEIVGKAVAKDTAAGKATLVSLLGLEAARAELAAAEAAAVHALEPFGDKAAVLIEAAHFVAHRKS